MQCCQNKIPDKGKTRVACLSSWHKIFIVALIVFFPVILSYYFEIFASYRGSLLSYIKAIWWAILLGIFIGGLIEYYVPKTYISNIFAHSGKRSIFNAVGLGFIMTFCSHGILALAIQFYKKGAATASVVAFLLASPWANISVTLLLISFFGIVKALYIIVSALIIAITTGLIFQVLEKKKIVESNPHSIPYDHEFSLGEHFMRGTREYKFSLNRVANDIKGIFAGMISLSEMVLWWILIGMGLASLAAAYVPEHFFHKFMGPNLIGMLVTLLLATVMEVCSEGTSPLAFEIFKQTGALGNSFVFLMAGVATDYTEIGLLWHNIGKRTALWLPLVTVPQILLLGYIANLIF